MYVYVIVAPFASLNVAVLSWLLSPNFNFNVGAVVFVIPASAAPAFVPYIASLYVATIVISVSFLYMSSVVGAVTFIWLSSGAVVSYFIVIGLDTSEKFPSVSFVLNITVSCLLFSTAHVFVIVYVLLSAALLIVPSNFFHVVPLSVEYCTSTIPEPSSTDVIVVLTSLFVQFPLVYAVLSPV